MAKAAVAARGSMKKEMTIQELERSGERGSVYVINSASQVKKGGGDILFSVPKKSGNGTDIVRVNKTWIPQDLTEQVTKSQLLDASEFRRTINKRLIRLIDPEYAKLVLEQEDAQEEQERINNLRQAAQNILRSNPVTDQDEEDEDDAKTPAVKRRRENIKHQNEQTGVTADDNLFSVFLNSLTGKSETEIVNALKSEGSFTRKELKKIRAKFGNVQKVAKFIQKRLEA